MSRAQMLTAVPIFVAVLVWLTRILFIGSLSVAGEQLMHGAKPAKQRTSRPAAQPAANRRPAMAMRAAIEQSQFAMEEGWGAATAAADSLPFW